MSSRLDLVVRRAAVVTPAGVNVADVGVQAGRIVTVAGSIAESGVEEVDAAGLHLFPGILDAHVHFNEPGREEWEGLMTGSCALAGGGGSWFGDMPLNSTPPVLDRAAFAAKARLAGDKSRTDFSIWGGLTPDNLDRIGELADCGVLALKAFMCGSGIADFPGITDAPTLRKAMRRAAEFGLLVGVHAEDEAMAARLTATARARGATDARSWLDTRPIEVELAAIRTATELAGETRCRLHVVHVSSPEGLALIAEARRRGVDVSAETCPHYLLLNATDVLRQGAPAKCAPPLRPEATRRALWEAARAGRVDTIGSDHSPAPPAMKTSGDFFAIWGGISSVQHGFPSLISAAVASEGAASALPWLASTLAASVARRFRLAGKGLLAPGHDADFSLLDLRTERVLTNEEVLYRHRQGPYAGRACRCTVRETRVRGRRVWHEGSIAPGVPGGQLIRPTTVSHG